MGFVMKEYLMFGEKIQDRMAYLKHLEDLNARLPLDKGVYPAMIRLEDPMAKETLAAAIEWEIQATKAKLLEDVESFGGMLKGAA